MADLILPSPAYTEQDGHFVNLEGKMQKAYKASYPTGSSKEEWEIINNISEILVNKTLFKDKDYLLDSMKNYLKLNASAKYNFHPNLNLVKENILIDDIDYYYSNVVARASKTMRECRNAMIETKKTGTEG